MSPEDTDNLNDSSITTGFYTQQEVIPEELNIFNNTINSRYLLYDNLFQYSFFCIFQTPTLKSKYIKSNLFILYTYVRWSVDSV